MRLALLIGLLALATAACEAGNGCAKNSDCPSGQLCDPIGLRCVDASTLTGGATTGTPPIGSSGGGSASGGTTGVGTNSRTNSRSPSGGSTGSSTSSPEFGTSTSSGGTTGTTTAGSSSSSASGGAPPLDGGTVTDNDGNLYATVVIGTQVWMAENLRTTTLNDGTPVALVADAGSWAGLGTPGYAWTNGDATTASRFGYLYNGYAVATGTLAPAGWHVATSADWTTLATTLGGVPVAGGALKEAGYNDWQSPNTGATNSSGFTALAGGYRDDTGAYQDFYAAGGWWSSTSAGPGAATFFFMDHINSYENSGTDSFAYGFSVRCVAN